MQCLAWWGAVWRSTVKKLHHLWGNIYQEIALLGYLNTFSEEISGVHSDRSLKYLSFLQRQCVVLSPADCQRNFILPPKKGMFARGLLFCWCS